DATSCCPLSLVQQDGRSSTRRQKRGRKIAVLDADKIISTLPSARGPFVQPIQLFVRQASDLSALAVVNVNGFHRRRVRHRPVAKTAKPADSRGDGLAVQLDGGLHAYNVGMIKLKALRNFEVAVAPRKFRIGRGTQRVAIRG